MIFVGDSKPGDSLCTYNLCCKLCTIPFITLFLCTFNSVICSVNLNSGLQAHFIILFDKVWQKYTLQFLSFEQEDTFQEDTFKMHKGTSLICSAFLVLLPERPSSLDV